MNDGYMNNIREKCDLLHKSILVELNIYDKGFNPVDQYRQHEIPMFLSDYVNAGLAEIRQSIEEKGTDKVYYFTNSIMMTFICLGLLNDDGLQGYIVVGPYLSSTDYQRMLREMIHTCRLPLDSLQVLQHYYESIPMIQSPQKEFLGQLIHNTLVNELISQQAQTELNEEEGLTKLIKSWHYEENITALKLHKRFEEKLVFAIERGLTKEALALHNQRDFSIESIMYINNSIRNGKNILMVANTLYSRAVNRGGVSLTYADSLSSKFIVLIERAKTLEELQQLSKKMIMDYCECVNRFAIKGYTPIIRQVMDHIQQHLQEEISLMTVAEHLNINKSYLSKLFKDEVGKTITDYIHMERIKRACYILEYEHMSMTEIASIVGYNDPNYFTRVFKKYKGITPTDYLKHTI